MFGPYNCADSTFHTFGRSRDTSPTLPPGCPVSDECSLRADNVIPQEIVVVYYVWDICLHQDHEVLVPLIDGMNRLGEAKAAAVLNVLHPQVDYWGLGRPALQ